MNEYFEAVSQEDSLKHYGRLGMKWYQHIYGEEQGHAKYAEKGIKRIKKNEARSAKEHAKADVKRAKAKRAEDKSRMLKGKFFFRFPIIDGIRERLLDKKAYRNSRKAYVAEKSAAKADKIIQKTTKFMNKYLADAKISDLSPEDVALGEKYALQFIKAYDEHNKK